MKANELRIGNYYLGASRGGIEIANGRMISQLEERKLVAHPIPLTEEWLLKFGFEFYDYQTGLDPDDEFFDEVADSEDILAYRKWQSKHIYYAISNSTYPPKSWEVAICRKTDDDSFVISHIHHVHQLQNLYFALTGTELCKN